MQTEKNLNSSEQFTQRKKDHIEISLKDESQAFVQQFSALQLQHNPTPEIDFSQVDLSTQVFGSKLKSPHFVSSMTLGHTGAQSLNEVIASQCVKFGWMMGVGSQRRQLFDNEAYKECESLREQFPELVLFGNIGLTQIIGEPVDKIRTLVDSLGAQFLVVHTNPLQEAIQPEGTPQFKGGIEALRVLCDRLKVPVVLKETGCGFSLKSFERLKSIGLSAIDVSGKGGTHWGRVEGLRMGQDQLGFKVAQTFSNWGISTVESLENGVKAGMDCELWASGGVRSGLDAAKLLALGACKVGFAQPILKSAILGEEILGETMKQFDYELKVTLFCLGLLNVDQVVGRRDLLK